MTAIDFQAEAEAMRDELVACRRDFHRHPELGFQEVRTAGIVAQELMRLGLEVQTGVGKTGVVGILEGKSDGPTVLVRADMDALPILEANQTDYVSTNAGKMHACGHDGHTTIGLAVAKLFAQHRDQIAGRIKFVFQPAEELGIGAAAMVKDGVMENPRPDVSLGLHILNSMPFGVLGVADGPTWAGSSHFSIKITGKGGHAASPHLGVDPIVCAAQVITALQSIVSRSVDPLESAVISVTTIHAGEAYNVIPQQVEMTGTTRTFKPEVGTLIERRMREVIELVARGMGCQAVFKLAYDTQPVVSHPEVGGRLRPIFRQFVGDQGLDLNYRTMWAEDVYLFMDDVPGMYFFLGAADSTADGYYGHHHPKFSFDENALPLGVTLMSAAVASYVMPNA